MYTMRNDTLQVTVEGGRLTSILDIQLEYAFVCFTEVGECSLMCERRRELLPKGPSAGFVIYEDHPNDWE